MHAPALTVYVLEWKSHHSAVSRIFRNIAVLKQSTEWVEEVEEGEDGQPRTRRFTRPKLDFVIGPVSLKRKNSRRVYTT